VSILKAEKLVKTFGRRRVVDGVSLDVQRGEIVGLLGPNGAGKTTTFRMICGQLKPDQGAVTLSGKDVTDWPMFQRARHGGMGYLPQQSSIFAKLTVQQNLLAMMQLLKMDRKTQRTRCDQLLEQFKISKLRKSRAGSLSGGERRRLEIARCLVSNPEIIMLDEPFAGIDPVTVQNIQEVICELRDSGLSILITDHAAREILQITDRTFVVSEGRILCSGSANEIVQHEEVKRKYLGEIDFVQPAVDDDGSAPVPMASTLHRNPRSTNQQANQQANPETSGKAASIDGDADTESIPNSIPVAETLPFVQPNETKPKGTRASRSRTKEKRAKKPAPPTIQPNQDPQEVVESEHSGRSIKRPKLTRTRTFDNIEAPFNSRDLE